MASQSRGSLALIKIHEILLRLPGAPKTFGVKVPEEVEAEFRLSSGGYTRVHSRCH